MKYTFILFFGVMLIAASCSKETSQEEVATQQKTDSVVTPVSNHKKSYDFRKRVVDFRVMPDKTIEEQVKKYETFADLFIEYNGIDKNPASYSPQEQEDNTQAYMILKDELLGIQGKLLKNISSITKEQEQRLDAADAQMNKLLPNVYKEDTTLAN